VSIFEVARGEETCTIPAHAGTLLALQFQDDGRTLVSAAADASVKLWNARTGELTGGFGGQGHGITVWDARTGVMRSERDVVGAGTEAIAFSPDGRTVVIGAGEAPRGALCTAISPDSRLLATGSFDGTVRLGALDATTGLLLTGEPHTDWVRAVVFSPNGRLLASCSDDGLVKIWNVRTRELERTLSGHTDWVRAVVFAPNGSFVASGGDDGKVLLFDPSTGELLRTLETQKQGFVGPVG
jgi:WD40 repeat protein